MKKNKRTGVVGAGTIEAVFETSDTLLGLSSIGKKVSYTGK